jgi:hypothetical protein
VVRSRIVSDGRIHLTHLAKQAQRPRTLNAGVFRLFSTQWIAIHSFAVNHSCFGRSDDCGKKPISILCCTDDLGDRWSICTKIVFSSEKTYGSFDFSELFIARENISQQDHHPQNNRHLCTPLIILPAHNPFKLFMDLLRRTGKVRHIRWTQFESILHCSFLSHYNS